MKLSLLKKNKEMYSKKTHSSTTRENNKFSLANAFCYRRSNSGKSIAKHPKTFGSKDEEINEAIPPSRASSESQDKSEETKVKQEILKEIDPNP